MKPSDYLAVQAKVASVVMELRSLSLDEFIRAAEHAETVCPFMEPTLYGIAGRRLSEIIMLAKAALDFRGVAAHQSSQFLESLRIPENVREKKEALAEAVGADTEAVTARTHARTDAETRAAGEVAGMLKAAVVVADSWNHAPTMVNEKEKVLALAALLRRLAADLKPAYPTERT